MIYLVTNNSVNQVMLSDNDQPKFRHINFHGLIIFENTISPFCASQHAMNQVRDQHDMLLGEKEKAKGGVGLFVKRDVGKYVLDRGTIL